MYLSALRSIGFLIPFLVSTVAEINQQQNDAENPFPARVARSFIIEYAPVSKDWVERNFVSFLFNNEAKIRFYGIRDLVNGRA